MALPTLQSLEECADYYKTVEPFLPELYQLPEKLIQTVQNRSSLVELYAATNPLVSGFAISVLLGAVFLVVSEVNKNYSQVDRCWSILPTIYIAHFDLWARLAGIPSQRLDAALLYSTIWSVGTFRPNSCRRLLTCGTQIRLTFNYARKGGYNIGSEDYRWFVPL